MGIPIYNFKKLHHEEMRAELSKRFAKIMEDNAFVDGPYNKSFEEKFARMTKAKHCLLVANGTDALEIALTAYGVGQGDKVGIPGITFYATGEAVLNVGAIPVMIDVDPTTGLMCPDSLKRVLNGTHLKAIMPVHIYGMPAPIEELEEICIPRGIKIIEDAAQAHGTKLKDVPVGGSQNLTTFSFYPTKNLSAFGDAGGICTQDDEMVQKLNSLRNHGRSPQGIQFFGRNSRCDHMQAAVLDLKVDIHEDLQKRRRDVAAKYMDSLSDFAGLLEFPAKNFLDRSSWHLFPVLLRNKEEKYRFKAHLDKHEVGSALFYEKPLGEEIPMQKFPGERAHSQVFSDRVICLPIHPCLEREEVEEVIRVVRSFFK